MMLQLMASFGLNVPYLVAGFAGGIVTLIFVQFPRFRALLTVPAGALVANYLTAVVQNYLKLPAASELGCAFIVGIIAIQIVRGIYLRGQKWEEDKTLPEDVTPQGDQS